MKKVVFAFFLVVLFAVLIAKWGTTKILDTSFYYSPDQASQFFSSLNPDEVAAYIRTAELDIGFLISYSLLSYLVAARLKMGQIKWMSLVPGLFDSIETMTFLNILKDTEFSQVPKWLGIVTCLKWSTGLLWILVLTVFAIRRWKKA